MPAQNRIWCDNRRHLTQQTTAETSPAPRQTAPLLVAESEFSAGELTPQDAVLFDQIGDDVLLMVIQPAGQERPTSWRTFLRAHWGAIGGADFFTTEVWTWQGLVTYYTLFVIDLASRRVQIVGSTPHPDEMFMRQIGRTLTAADDGALLHQSVLICDRDRKWSGPVRQLLVDAGIRVVQTPFQAPNANAHAERFVRSIKSECLDRVIVLGERHLRQAIREFMAHYHRERNHQGLRNELIEASTPVPGDGRRIRRRKRLGGLLNYYARAA